MFNCPVMTHQYSSPLNYRFATTTLEIPGFSGLPMELQVFPDYPWNYRFSRTTHEIPGVLRKFQVLYDYSSRFSNTNFKISRFSSPTNEIPCSPELSVKFKVQNAYKPCLTKQNYQWDSKF